MVFATPHAIRESSRSKLQPETDIRPLARGLLQRFRLDAIVSRPVYLCDHDTGCCQDGKFPFQIARTNSASGNSFRSWPNGEGSVHVGGKDSRTLNPVPA